MNGGQGGREHERITGRRRRAGLRPGGSESALPVGRHGGYAVARAGHRYGRPGAEGLLELGVPAKGDLDAWVITQARSGLPPKSFAYCSTARTSCAGRRRRSQSRARPRPWAEPDIGSRASFQKPSASAGCPEGARGMLERPLGRRPARASPCKGLRPRDRLECGGEFLKIEKPPEAFSDLKV